MRPFDGNLGGMLISACHDGLIDPLPLKLCAEAGVERVVSTTPTDLTALISELKSSGSVGTLVFGTLRSEAARLAYRYSGVRHSAGSANVLLFKDETYGHNSEVPGFMHPIANAAPGTALILGTGIGARTAAMGLLLAGWKVRVWNRNRSKSKMLISALQTIGDIDALAFPDPGHADLIVNATPLGKKAGECPPLDWVRVKRGATVYDLVYRSVPTEFLRQAANRGLPTIDGRESLIAGLALGMEWLGIGPSWERLREVAYFKNGL